MPTVARGAMVVFAGTVASTALAFVAKIVLARSTSTAEFGVFSLALAVASIVSLLGTLGMFEGATRCLAHAIGSGDSRAVEGLRRATKRISVRSGIVVGTLLWLAARPVAIGLLGVPELATPLRIVAVSIPFLILVHNLVAILRAHGALATIALVSSVGNPLLQLIGFLLCAGLALPLSGYLWVYVVAAMIVCASLGYFAHRLGRGMQKSSPSRDAGRQLLRASLPLLLVSALSLTLSWIDVLMLGRYADTATVGVYSAGVSLARLLTLPLTSLVFALTPVCVRLLAEGNEAELSRVYQITTRWVFAATLVPFFFLFFFADWWLGFLFGERFTGAAHALRFLAAGMLFSAFLGGNAMLLIVYGLTRELVMLAGLGVLVGVASNYVLIHVLGYGAVGAAVAMMTTYGVVNVATSALAYAKRRVHPFTRAHWVSAAILPLLALPVYAIKAALTSSLLSMGIGFALVAGGYLAVMRSTGGFGERDLSLMRRLLTPSGWRKKSRGSRA